MSKIAEVQWQWFDRNGWPLDLNAVYAENEFKGDSIAEIQKAYMERLDGGPGSGNWGHAGRPGIGRGGSAAGTGGKRWRLTTQEGGFTSINNAYKENEKWNSDPENKKRLAEIKEARNPTPTVEELRTRCRGYDGRLLVAQQKVRSGEMTEDEYIKLRDERNDLVKRVLKTPDDCKDEEDVSNYLKAQAYFRCGKDKQYNQFTDTNQEINLEEADFESAKGIAIACDNVFEAFPQAIGNIDSIKMDALPLGTYGQCRMFTIVGRRTDGETWLNTSYFSNGNTEKANKSYLSDIMVGFHPAKADNVTAAQAVATHELGHAIDAWISYNFTTHRGHTKGDSFGADARRFVAKKLGKLQGETATSVSEYARENTREFFAECIGDALTGGPTNIISKEVLAFAQETIKNGEAARKGN